jgi:hypothetical protein
MSNFCLNLDPRPSKEHNAYCYCYLTQSPITFGTVCHHSISPTPHGDQINKETEIVPTDSDPPFANGNRPSSTAQCGQWPNFAMNMWIHPSA